MRRVLMSWLLSPLGFVGLFLLLFSFQSMAESETLAFETLDMRPDQPPSWSGRHLSAPIVSLFRGTDYMYAERTFRIETTPAHGYLDIFYVRSGFQKKFEQAESPVEIIIPARIESSPRDSLTIRAFAEGYEQSSVRVEIDGKVKDLVIDLEPLPNKLEAIEYRYFAGRATLTFVTKESLMFRVQDSESGYAVILNQTAISPAAAEVVERIQGPNIIEAYHQQLGDDLMVGLVLRNQESEETVDLRSRQAYDAPRDVHLFEVDLVSTGSSAASVENALAALARVQSADVSGCAAVFDDKLRRELDSAELARALRPRGAFSDRYLRAAMRRLGEVSVDQTVDFEDGSRLRLESPLELEMAITNSSTARGYLSLLRRFVSENEVDSLAERQGFRSLLAPSLTMQEFEQKVGVARAAEAKCRNNP
ncbi:MAG: hypothetical protein CL917_12535 [Deltaproteobacteria bacterium]|nr:hypothetical protein [Deltaproteobacteria bacterium]